MKKTVKFSGTEDDKIAYLTDVIIPKKKENLRKYFKSIKSSAQLGEKVDQGVFSQGFRDTDRRFAKLELQEDKIILRLRYVAQGIAWRYGIEDAKRDAFHIVEQIETLIDAFEEEAD